MTQLSCKPFSCCLCSAFDYDTENMNSEDIYSSLKGVTEAIQNFSVRSQEDMNEPIHRQGEEVSGGGGGYKFPLLMLMYSVYLTIYPG